MGKETSIPWCDHTFNPWIGCAKVSLGCANCFAAVDTPARVSRGKGIELWGKDAARRVTSDANWRKPVAWDREAGTLGVRRRVFCASQADVFEDRPDLVEPRARLWQLILYSHSLDWLLLTKRPENVLPALKEVWEYQKARALRDDCLSAWIDGSRPPANVWLGVSVEDQARADERITRLLELPARVRWVSYEPALGPVNFEAMAITGRFPHVNALTGVRRYSNGLRVEKQERGNALDWIVVGGESGHGARPFDLAWARSTIDQCRVAGVKVFMKQVGAQPQDHGDGRDWPDGVRFRKGVGPGSAVILRDPKGGDPSEWPDWAHVREFPAPAAGKAVAS